MLTKYSDYRSRIPRNQLNKSINGLIAVICGERCPHTYIPANEQILGEARIPNGQFPIILRMDGSLEDVIKWAYKKKSDIPEAEVTIELPGGTIVPVEEDE